MTIKIPADWPVQPLEDRFSGDQPTTCGTCGLTWDDAIGTSITPAPSGRCPFEYFHEYPEPAEWRQASPQAWRRLRSALSESELQDIAADITEIAKDHDYGLLDAIEEALIDTDWEARKQA